MVLYVVGRTEETTFFFMNELSSPDNNIVRRTDGIRTNNRNMLPGKLKIKKKMFINMISQLTSTEFGPGMTLLNRKY